MELKNEDLISDDIEQSQDEETENEKMHKIWKKNAPYLYDLLITWGLDWPSLSVSWWPNLDYLKDRPFYLQKMALGTYTGAKENDYLLIGKVRLPISKAVLEAQPPEKSLTKEDLDNFNKLTNDQLIEEYKKFDNKLEIETKIRHDGEVNKVKINPINYNMIATQTNKGEIHVFNYHKFPPKPKDDVIPEPTKRFKFHTQIGYALSWSLLKEDYLLSGSYDGTVCLWDTNSNNSDPVCHYHEHASEVEDVCFSKKLQYIFGTCGDDKSIKIMDYRTDKSVISIIGHDAEVNSMDFNPENEFLYITGSGDKTIALWDLRKPNFKLYSFKHHKNSIINVKWNNRKNNIFASSGEDNKVLIWDLTQIGENLGNNDGIPSEMIFEHGGHMDKINDFDWNQNEDMMCASIDNSNNLQIWEMNMKNIINNDIQKKN